MFALLAKSALCAALFSVSTSPAHLFANHASTHRVQSRMEDRAGKSDTPAKELKASKKTVWNLDGGIFFATDGHLLNGSCFRLSGQMTAPDFFDGLRRVDTTNGTFYTLRDKVVTEYPDEVQITLHLLDFPCTLDLKDSVVRPPITREMMSTLRLNFYWKSGITLRPVETSKRTSANIKRLAPYSTDSRNELAPRFEWNYEFTVASEKVPLTNDLVIVIENEEKKIAARVAARL
jgi:hypothetical protein